MLFHRLFFRLVLVCGHAELKGQRSPMSPPIPHVSVLLQRGASVITSGHARTWCHGGGGTVPQVPPWPGTLSGCVSAVQCHRTRLPLCLPPPTSAGDRRSSHHVRGLTFSQRRVARLTWHTPGHRGSLHLAVCIGITPTPFLHGW